MHLTLVKREITHTEKHTVKLCGCYVKVSTLREHRWLSENSLELCINVHDLGFLNNLFVYVVIHIPYRTIRVRMNHVANIFADVVSYKGIKCHQIYFNCAQELSKDLPTPDKKKVMTWLNNTKGEFICNSKNDVHFKIKSPVIALFRHLLSVTYMCRAREKMNKVMLCNDVWYIETNFPVHYQLDVICCDPCQCWHELSFITN